MKKCIHCGAQIKGSAAVFCPKCKKPLKKKPQKRRPVQTKQKKPPQPAGKQTDRRRPPPKKTAPQVKKNIPQHKPKLLKKKLPKNKKSWLSFLFKPKNKKKPVIEHEPVINPMDENYDGYYDNTPTDDNAQNKDALDPELIKRIVFISAGAVGIVIFAIILMFLL
jgi:hypothetical protein